MLSLIACSRAARTPRRLAVSAASRFGASYGDDAQMATNYPLVRITNNSTGDVRFARTYNFLTMGVFTKGTTNASFDVPSSCETGTSTAKVIVNGLASPVVNITVN